MLIEDALESFISYVDGSRERRRSPRRPVAGVLALWDGGLSRSLLLRDVSRGGVFGLSSVPLSVGHVVAVDFAGLRRRATVARALPLSATEIGLGVRFEAEPRRVEGGARGSAQLARLAVKTSLGMQVRDEQELRSLLARGRAGHLQVRPGRELRVGESVDLRFVGVGPTVHVEATVRAFDALHKLARLQTVA